MGKIYDWFQKPQTALLLIALFLTGYILYNSFAGGFGENLLKFGPTKDENGNYTTYMGLKLDNWKNVIVVYVLVFISTVLQYYYGNVIFQNIHAYVFNPAVKEVPFSKLWTYVILMIDPLIRTFIYVVQFFATATFQIQYIIPQFVAGYITDLPFVLKWLSGKTFTG